MLRRTKLDPENWIQLEELSIEVVHCSLSAEHRLFYDRIVQRRDFEVWGVKIPKFESNLALLIRSIQACLLPKLVCDSVRRAALEGRAMEGDVEEDEGGNCALPQGQDLLDLLGTKSVLFIMKFVFSLIVYISSLRRSPRTHTDTLEIPEIAKSTKMEKMLQILTEIKQRTHPGQPREKTLIFSQFTTFLDIVDDCLLNNGYESNEIVRCGCLLSSINNVD